MPEEDSVLLSNRPAIAPYGTTLNVLAEMIAAWYSSQLSRFWKAREHECKAKSDDYATAPMTQTTSLTHGTFPPFYGASMRHDYAHNDLYDVCLS